ncbi:hypothetical protein [Sutcliffiella deserti]|uniref:hypothetical protein n=1 Tax=Sutcliffiella deserti TaxID=2875501 RepID=UPI001CBE8EC4|nr:hypothetical protein [Sutcliffiella deserti]
MYRDNKPFDLSPYDQPNIYPGPRPNSSFLFWKGKAHRMSGLKGLPLEQQSIYLSNTDHILGSLAFNSFEERKVEDFLGGSSIKEKIPVVAYGSNVCLAQLRYKFSLRPSDSDFMLCVKGEITDSDIVYSSFLAPYGSLPAVIAPMKGAKTEVWITFMDEDQLKLINATEKDYELREHTGKKLVLNTGEVFDKVYAYYVPKALLWEGEMVRFKDIPSTSTLQEKWHIDMLDDLKKKVDFLGTREEFIHLLRWNFSYREFIEKFLREHTYEFEHPDWLPVEKISTIGEMSRSFG